LVLYIINIRNQSVKEKKGGLLQKKEEERSVERKNRIFLCQPKP
jgi:hypothetical protein